MDRVQGDVRGPVAPPSSGWRLRDWLEWVAPAVVAVGAAGLLVAASAPSWWFPVTVASALVALAGSVIWFFRLVVDAAATGLRPRTNDGDPDRGRRANAFWAMVVVPVIIVGAWTHVRADLPLRVRWQLSRSAFVEAVDGDVEIASSGTTGRWVGLYEVREIERFDDAVLFTDARDGFMASTGGFAYLPFGPTDDLVQDAGLEAPTFRDLGEGWYAWTASW